MNKLTFIIILLAVAFLPIVQAQDTYEVTIQCRDGQTAIVGAEVRLGELYNLTDWEGNAYFSNVEGGSHLLTVAIDGIVRHQKEVSIYENAIFALDFEIEDEAPNPDEVDCQLWGGILVVVIGVVALLIIYNYFASKVEPERDTRQKRSQPWGDEDY